MDQIKASGMGGSNNGKNRYEGTASLKKRSTKKRRSVSVMREVAASLGMTVVRGAVSGKYYIE